ncbi:MAG: hypothetical protein ACYTEG_17705, partial [Planctomycetota bacterium]
NQARADRRRFTLAVYGGAVAIVLIVVGVLAGNDVLSADAAGILIGGTLVYAVIILRDYFLD